MFIAHRYLTDQNPATKIKIAASATQPKYFSMKSRMGGPNTYKSPATKKNLMARATMVVVMNKGKDIDVAPDMIVITLKGNGVTPAVKMVHIPTSLNRWVYSAMASELPIDTKIGCAIWSNATAPIKYPNNPPKTDAIVETNA